MHDEWTSEKIAVAYRPVHEAVTDAVRECADALLQGIAGAMQAPPGLEIWKSNPMTPAGCEEGTEFLRTFEHGGARYTALAEVSVHDSLNPGVAVRAAVGRGEAEHAIEIRTPVQHFWNLERPGTSELVLDHIRRISARAEEIGRLTAPILVALDEESMADETILNVTIPSSNPTGPLRIADPNSA